MEERNQERIDFEVINPKGTNWCSLEAAREISAWIAPESRGELANMLPQGPENLLSQMEEGITRLAIWNDKVIGHITLWEYNTSGWGEIGSLIVAPSFRGQGIGRELVKVFSSSFSNPIQLVATTKTERARFVFLISGFEEIRPLDKESS